MDNQVIQQILNTQTQMLQHLTTLQQQQSVNNMNMIQNNTSQNTTDSYGTPIPGQVASPVTPPPMSVADPTQYGTYASPYYTDGGRIPVGTQFNPKNLVRSSFNEAMSFNPAGQSIEASSNYMYQQSQGVQMGAMNAIGGALKGGTTVGSLFIPGLVPSLIAGGAASAVVGGIANTMIGGARTALDYQSVLQQKGPEFISAFNSTNDMGGIGWGLKDQQQASRFLRELAPQEFMSNGDMQKVLSGASDNGLLKNVTDVKDFQKKFKDIVGAVKDITVTMNQTIDQATQFMGEMQQMGIMSKDMPLVAAQTKVMASTLGITSDQATQMVLGGGQQLAQGTGMSAGGAVKNTAENMFYAQNLWNNAPDGSTLKNLINNNGGPGQVGANYSQSLTGYVNSQTGGQTITGLFASAATIDKNGNVTIDQNKLKDILSGNQSASSLTQASVANISKLNPGQQVELAGKIGEEFTNMAGQDSSVLPAVAQRVAKAYQQQAALSGTKMDLQVAYVQSGLAPDYNTAQLMTEMGNQATNPQLKSEFEARSMKQAQDAHAIANSPSIFARANYWWQSNVEAPFAGAGQDVSDSVGQAALGYQKWLTGMSDRSTVNAENLQSFDEKGLEKTFGNLKSVDTLSNNMNNYLNKRNAQDWTLSGANFNDQMTIQGGKANASQVVKDLRSSKKSNQGVIGGGMFDTYMSEASKGEMSPADIAKLANEKNLGFMDRTRRMMIESQATGQYDGVGGKVNWALDEAGYGLLSIGDWASKHSPANLFGLSNPDPEIKPKVSGDTYSSLQTQSKKLEDEKKKLNQDTAALFASKDVRGMSQSGLQALQSKIMSGDIDGVKSITSNKQATDLAQRAKSLNGLDTQYSTAMGSYTQASQYTQALANTGNLLGDTFSAAGMDQGKINDILGAVRDTGKQMSKDLKNHKLSVGDMGKDDQDIMNKLNQSFGSMTEYDKETLVQYMKDHDSNFKMKNVVGSDGKSIDSSKLENQMLNLVHNENLAPKNKQAKNTSESDVSKAAKDHTQAMYDMLTTFQQETQMMNDAANGQPVTNYSSSLGTRGS